MDAMTRDSLRNAVIDTLLTTFPKGQKVAGGIAFISETMDEDTGLYYPVEIKVSVKNTQATARAEAYDLEAAVAAFAAKPGRRVADPVKKAARDAAKAVAAEKKAALIGALRDYFNNNLVNGMTATDIYNAIPELQTNTLVMNVGMLLKELVEEGVAELSFNDKRKKVYYNGKGQA